jgi:hypothetical protein
MPKPGDLSVLGLRPHNDLTSTRMLSSGMQACLHRRDARAVLVATDSTGRAGHCT